MLIMVDAEGCMRLPKRMNFQNISLYIEDIFDIKIVPKCANVDMSPKNRQYDFSVTKLAFIIPKICNRVTASIVKFRVLAKIMKKLFGIN